MRIKAIINSSYRNLESFLHCVCLVLVTCSYTLRFLILILNLFYVNFVRYDAFVEKRVSVCEWQHCAFSLLEYLVHGFGRGVASIKICVFPDGFVFVIDVNFVDPFFGAVFCAYELDGHVYVPFGFRDFNMEHEVVHAQDDQDQLPAVLGDVLKLQLRVHVGLAL